MTNVYKDKPRYGKDVTDLMGRLWSLGTCGKYVITEDWGSHIWTTQLAYNTESAYPFCVPTDEGLFGYSNDLKKRIDLLTTQVSSSGCALSEDKQLYYIKDMGDCFHVGVSPSGFVGSVPQFDPQSREVVFAVGKPLPDTLFIVYGHPHSNQLKIENIGGGDPFSRSVTLRGYCHGIAVHYSWNELIILRTETPSGHNASLYSCSFYGEPTFKDVYLGVDVIDISPTQNGNLEYVILSGLHGDPEVTCLRYDSYFSFRSWSKVRPWPSDYQSIRRFVEYDWPHTLFEFRRSYQEEPTQMGICTPALFYAYKEKEKMTFSEYYGYLKHPHYSYEKERIDKNALFNMRYKSGDEWLDWRADVVTRHIVQMRDHIELLCSHALETEGGNTYYLNPSTGNPYNWLEDSEDNLYYCAMGDRSDYGATGGSRYTWTRTEREMVGTDTYDIDIGEIAECVTLLEKADHPSQT